MVHKSPYNHPFAKGGYFLSPLRGMAGGVIEFDEVLGSRCGKSEGFCLFCEKWKILCRDRTLFCPYDLLILTGLKSKEIVPQCGTRTLAGKRFFVVVMNQRSSERRFPNQSRNSPKQSLGQRNGWKESESCLFLCCRK